jgi:hypothetical protein
MRAVASVLFWFFLMRSALGGQLAEMENDMLVRAFKGWTVPGYSESKLKSELQSDQASVLIEKCMGDERLKKTLPAFPQDVADDRVRENLIQFILEEPGVWYSDESPEAVIDQVAVMQVGGFVDKSLRKEFFLSPDDADMPKLSKAIFRKSTRYLVADLFTRLTKLEKSQRQPDSPEVVALITELRQTLARIDKGETGARRSQSLPRRETDDNREISDLKALSLENAAMAASEAKAPPKRWVFVAIAACLLGVAWVVFFRSRETK